MLSSSVVVDSGGQVVGRAEPIHHYRPLPGGFPPCIRERGGKRPHERARERAVFDICSEYSPVFYVGATCERMAENHAVVAVFIQLSPRLISNWDVCEYRSRLELKGW